MAETNYTLGRGIVYFSEFSSGQTPGPFRDVGNVPELNYTIEREELEHFSSRAGARERDEVVSLSVNHALSLIFDDILADNLAAFFLSEAEEFAHGILTSQSQDISSPKADEVHFLGLSASDRIGARGVDTVAIAGLVLDTDYTLDADRGRIEFLVDQAADVTVTYVRTAALTSTRIEAGSVSVEGALRFIENNAAGVNRDMIIPRCTLSPNGDFSLISDEWRQVPITVDILKPSSGALMYIDGIPK